MDLQKLAPSSADILVTLKHGDKVIDNDDGTPMTWTLYSPFSREAKAVLHDMVDERLSKAAETGNTKLKSAELENYTLEVISRTTKEWNITWASDKPEFTFELAKEILFAAPFIKDQLEAAQNNAVNFTKG